MQGIDTGVESANENRAISARCRSNLHARGTGLCSAEKIDNGTTSEEAKKRRNEQQSTKVSSKECGEG